MKRMNRVIRIPMVAGGNVKRQEDIKKILYAGAKRAILNFSKQDSVKLIEDASKRFGKEKLAVSLNDFDALFKHQHVIRECCSEIIFMHRLDLNSVANITSIPCVVVTDTMDQPELFKILKSSGVKGLSGRFISQPDMDFVAFKEKCEHKQIRMTSFESRVEFSEFKTNDQGLIPVIVQNPGSADAGLYEQRSLLSHDQDRQDDLLQPEQTKALGKGGDQRAFPVCQVADAGLR